jgi:hypothetical protein
MFCALAGCNRRPAVALSTTTVLGSYNGNYPNGNAEMFTIRPDGSFSQVLSKGGAILYSNEGRWKIETPNYVIFDNVFMGVDLRNSTNRNGAYTQPSSFRAGWNPYGPRIIFSDDADYWIEKVPDNAAK